MAASVHFTIPVRGSSPRSFPSSANTNICIVSPPGVSHISKARREAPLGVVSAVPKFKGTQTREQRLSDMIVEKIGEAKQICEGNENSDECRVAWDEVEEVSQAKAHLRQRSELHDPLESFCKDNPESDECRIYED